MTSFAEATRTARAILTEDGGRLWGISLADVEWLGFDGDTIHLTADPHRPGYELGPSGLWSGPAPTGIPPANTALDWAGSRWAGVELPLPEARKTATRLLLHEAWHVRERRVITGQVDDTPPDCPGVDLLDSALGRTWLRLEVAALADALLAAEAADQRWRTAAADALLFRHRRLADAPVEESNRERALDILEGLAEYTAWRLTGATIGDVAERALRLPTGDNSSWVRSFPYHTGPAYALLLDECRSDWRDRARETPDLQALLAAVVPALSVADADSHGRMYGLADICDEEGRRDNTRQARIDTLRQAFAPSAVLRLARGASPFSFHPSKVVPMGTGTVYHDFGWRAEDGSELAANRALVTSDWKEIWLPLGQAKVVPGEPPLTLDGDGWTLQLADGWRLRQTGDTWLAEPTTNA